MATKKEQCDKEKLIQSEHKQIFKEMNVYQKINEVKKIVKTFSKDAKTSGKGAYTYISGSQILSTIKEKMEEIGLLLLPVATEHRGYQTYNYNNSYGELKTDFLVDGKLYYEWINIDNPTDRQRVEFEYYGQQNDLSKAFGSALTYSERYVLLKSLGVPTDEDDPDKETDDKTQNTSNLPQNTKQQTRYQIIMNKAKQIGCNYQDIKVWIQKKYEKEIKINDLTEEQYNELNVSLDKKIEEVKLKKGK